MKLKKSDRERAKYAFEKVKEVKAKAEEEGRGKKDKELKLLNEYASHVKSFPVMILQNGLGNAVAFAFDKSNKNQSWKFLLRHLMGWLAPQESGEKNFIEHQILNATSSQYRQRQNEALALFKWLKRFAEGMSIKSQPQQDEEQSNG